MRPTMFMGAQGLPAATFVGWTSQFFPSPGTHTMPLADISGLQVDDYVFIFTTGGAGDPGVNPVIGWTTDAYRWPVYGYPSSTIHRRLATLTPPKLIIQDSTGVLIAAYRGASQASRKVVNFDNDGNATQVVPGFTRATDCVGVMSQIWERDTEITDISPSAGWTRRALTTSFFRTAIADALPRSAYADGAALTWSDLATGGPFAQVAQMYELRA